MPTIGVYGQSVTAQAGTWTYPERAVGAPDSSYARLTAGAVGALGVTNWPGTSTPIVITAVTITAWVDSPDSRTVSLGVTINNQYLLEQAGVAVSSGQSAISVSWTGLTRAENGFASIIGRVFDVAGSPTGFGVDAVYVVITYELQNESKSVSDAGTVTGADDVSAQVWQYPAAADTGGLSAGLEALDVTWIIGVSESGDIAGADAVTRAITAPVTDAGTVTASESVLGAQLTTAFADAGGIVGAAEAVSRQVRPAWLQRRMRAVCRDGAGAVAARLPVVLEAEYKLALDRIGEWSVTVPAEHAVGIVPGTVRSVDLHREDEGLVVRGVLEHVEHRVQADGAPVAVLSGATLGRELALPTIVSYSAVETQLATVASALVNPHGWSIGLCPSVTVTVTAAGVSPWQALSQVVDRLGLHLREDPLRRVIDIIDDPAPSGLTYSALAPAPEDERAVMLPVLEATVERDASSVWTRVIPYAEPVEGRSAKLQESTRTAPYTIQSGTAEDGSTYYYLQDNAAAATHGVRAVVQTWRGIAPLDDTSAEAERAANALYDAAAGWLMMHATAPLRVRIRPAPAYHLDTGGLYRLSVGQTVGVVVRAAMQLEAGTRMATVDVAQEHAVLSISRKFAADGSDSWDVDTADVMLPRPDDLDQLAQAMSVVATMQLGAPQVAASGGGGSGVRTIWDTLIEASWQGQLGTPWW